MKEMIQMRFNMKNKSIVWGFSNESDLKKVLDRFDSTLVQSKGIIPPIKYRIIGRLGYNGSCVYRNENNLKQWYSCVFLDDFQKIPKKSKTVKFYKVKYEYD